jgi:hypothetical protein
MTASRYGAFGCSIGVTGASVIGSSGVIAMPGA